MTLSKTKKQKSNAVTADRSMMALNKINVHAGRDNA